MQKGVGIVFSAEMMWMWWKLENWLCKYKSLKRLTHSLITFRDSECAGGGDRGIWTIILHNCTGTMDSLLLHPFVIINQWRCLERDHSLRFKESRYKNERRNKVGCIFAKSMSAVGPTSINNSVIANCVDQMWLVLVHCRWCWCWNFIAPRNTYIYHSATKCLLYSSLVRLYSVWRTHKKIDASWNEESRYRHSESHTCTRSHRRSRQT